MGLAGLCLLIAGVAHVMPLPMLLAAGSGLGLVGMLISENLRISDVLLFEEGEDVNFVRDVVTLKSGGAACVIGQVLAKVITSGVATETHAGNTGNGVMTIDVATPVLPNAKAGDYKVICTAAAANGGTFRVFDPMGNVLGDVAVAAAFANQIKFVIADGATDFIVGDTFLVKVEVDTLKYVQVNPAGLDGSQIACAVALVAGDPTAADVNVVAVVRGPAVLKSTGLAWTAGMTAAQQAAALIQLAERGMKTETAFGV